MLSLAKKVLSPDLDGKRLSFVGVELLLISFVVLFQELALIRWLPGQVRVLAYFPNLILLSAFLGLGLGCLRARARSLLWMWPASLVVLVGVAWLMSTIRFTNESPTEHLWLLYYDLPEGAPVFKGVRAPIIIAFLLSALTFIPLGQMVAMRLSAFRQRSSSLWGYAWDILGSLTGVLVFFVVSYLGTFPFVWFAIFLPVGLVFCVGRRWIAAILVPAVVAVLLMVHTAEKAEHYSPYYALAVSEADDLPGFRILANGSWHQSALALRWSDWPRSNEANSTADKIREGYHLPYRVFAGPRRRGLVLGAGTGNDVAVMLDEGFERVDAVEIDPVILELGRTGHPNRPYDDPRVRVFNTDARSFLNSSDDTYDLIVFGTLDSMTRLSALSNVRLDNFVYTTDCLRAARKRLEPNGGLVMYFMVARRYIHERLKGMLGAAFGENPGEYHEHHVLFNTIYFSGPAFADFRSQQNAFLARQAAAEGKPFPPPPDPTLHLPNDDWPFLYLQDRTISRFYLSIMAMIATMAVVGVAAASVKMRRSLMTARGVDAPMFLFGLAFLLIETKSVTEMNLLWGATWLTSAVVFGSILVMILLATVLTKVRSPGWRWSVTGLGIALIIARFVPYSIALGADPVVKLGLSALLLGLPIFFASICFAEIFAKRENVDIAFGWNLLGAVAGGLVEFLAMTMGFRALTLVAFAVYALAVILLHREQTRSADAPTASERRRDRRPGGRGRR